MALTKKELRQFLLQHSREQLADWLQIVAKDSPDFKQRLQFYVATHVSWEAAQQATYEAIERFGALQSAHQTPKPPELAKQGRFLLESLRACLDFHPETGLGELVERAMVSFDQMASEEPKLAELQREFATLHVRVTEIDRPEPTQLAERLFQLRSNSMASILPDSPRAYVHLLGSVGLERYRQLLEPTYQVVVHGEKPSHRTQREAKQYLNRRLMLFEWATITEDVDEQVAILLAMSRNPEDVLTVAKYLERRQRPMDAIEIVKQAHQKSASPKLAGFLAERYEKQNQAAEALPYRWYLLEREPSREHFDDLMRAAGNGRQLAEWRERAVKLTSEQAKGLYIELLLAEEKLDEALSEARQHGARLSIWVRLAEGYALRDPRLAIELYFDCAEFALKERAPDSHIAMAWSLAVDNITFQVFDARLNKFFARHKVSERYVARLVEAGIPVAKLLGRLDTHVRKE